MFFLKKKHADDDEQSNRESAARVKCFYLLLLIIIESSTNKVTVLSQTVPAGGIVHVYGIDTAADVLEMKVTISLFCFQFKYLFRSNFRCDWQVVSGVRQRASIRFVTISSLVVVVHKSILIFSVSFF